ncbi:MAG: hypothetical protein ACR2GH_09460 [Pseudonocardia sp.]
MSETLVVEAEDEYAEPQGSMDGGGVASSWADLGNAVDNGDPLQIAFAGAAAGLDTLGFVADPFDAFLVSTIGYVIEHVSFLHEPLDALAGDPTQIMAQARTWHNVAVRLTEVAAELREKAAGLPGWDGAAGDAYRGQVHAYTSRLDGAAGQAERLSGLILGTGVEVGTLRALIRDLIAEFLAWAAKIVLAALALVPVTMAGSTAAAIGTVVWEAVRLADDIAERISGLLDALSAAGGTAGQIADRMREAATQVRAIAPQAQHVARTAGAAADGKHAGEVVELGNQVTRAAQDQHTWRTTESSTILG